MTYDAKCEDLARSFLSDNPALDAEKLAPILAAQIQATVEDFIAGETSPPLPTSEEMDRFAQDILTFSISLFGGQHDNL